MAYSEVLTPMESAAIPSPSRSKEDRFTGDRFIRSQGWEIYRRPKRGEPVWTYHRPGLPDLVLVESAVLEKIGR